MHQIIDRLKESYNGRIVGPYRVLLYKPNLAEVVCNTADQIRKETTLEGEIRELVTIIIARQIDCVYIWSAHQPGALQSGVPIEVIDAIEKKLEQNAKPKNTLSKKYGVMGLCLGQELHSRLKTYALKKNIKI